jgi:hypothetical protein
MIDLKIEESLSRETLMNIDSSNSKEDIVTMGLFSVLLGIIVVLGILSPPKDSVSSYVSMFKPNSTTSIFALRNITKWNHYVFSSASFIVKEFAAKTTLENVTFQISITKSKNGERSLFNEPEIYQENLVVQAKSNKTESFRVLFDHYPDYDEIIVIIRLGKDQTNSIIGIQILWEYGNESQPLLQIFTRCVFALICTLAFLMLCKRLCTISFTQWHLEQKLTVILVLLCIFADNPFYILQILKPTLFAVYVEIIIQSLFFAYFRFFIITLFSSLAYKNRSIPSCFFIPKVAFMVIDFAVDALHTMLVTNEIPDESIPFEISSDVESYLFIAKATVLSIFALWAVFAIIRASLFIDITEKYKFRVYIVCSIIALVHLILVLIFEKLGLFSETSLIFLTTFAIQNYYVILMAVFHWPFEMITDQEYQNAELNDDDISHFFINELDTEQLQKIGEEEEEKVDVPVKVEN